MAGLELLGGVAVFIGVVLIVWAWTWVVLQ